MRVIKFRAWDKVGRFFAALGEDADYMMGFDSDGEVFIIDNGQPRPQRFDIQQFTGLLDKNGREIYESDQINAQYRVVYLAPKYVLQDISNGDICDFREVTNYEITGNESEG